LSDARTPTAHNQAWNTINNTPTTLAGYGITDAYNSSNPAGYISGITSANVTTALGFTPYNATNPSGYINTAGARAAISVTGSGSYDSATGIITVTGGVTSVNSRTGAVTITSADVTGALGYTPYNSTNPSGYITSSALSGYLTSSTAASTYLPLSGGTLSGLLTINGGSLDTTYTSSQIRFADGSLQAMKTVTGGVFEAFRAINNNTTAGTTVRVLGAATSDPFNNTNGGKVFIDAVRTATNMDLVFSLNDAAGVAPVERFRFYGSGNFNAVGAITQNGNQVLHAANYNSYAPTLTGTGASGTWGISITGNSAGLADNNAWMLYRGTVAEANIDTATANGFYQRQNTGEQQGLLVMNPGGSLGIFQMYMQWQGGLQFRNKTDSATWNAWKTVLTSLNYNSYALPLSGGTVTGATYFNNIADVAGDFYIRGRIYSLNAASNGWNVVFERNGGTPYITNVTYAGNTILHAGNYDSYAMPYIASSTRTLRFDTTSSEHITFQNQTSGGVIQLGFQQNDTDGLHHRAYFKFYKSAAGTAAGVFDIVIRSAGGGTTGDIFKLQAGSAPTWAGSTMLTAANYTSYSPSLTGSGASGTWGINVTGSAGSIANNNVADYFRITNTGGSQRLLMGNQDSAGVNNPSMMIAANGVFQFGNGNSWSGSGGAFSSYSEFNTSYISHTSSLRAPIFYDSDNTGYYIDQNSTSNINTLSVNQINNIAPRTDWWHTSSEGKARFYFSPNSTTYYRTGGNFVWRNNSDSGIITSDANGFLRVNSGGDNFASYPLHVTGTGYASGDFRAPIFYDSENTSYYVDPTSTSNLNSSTSNTAYAGYFCGLSGNGYGWYKGYDNNNHFITIRGAVSGTTTALSITGAHQTTFVEHMNPANTTCGWFFKDSYNGGSYNYPIVARIHRNESWFEGDLYGGSSVRAPIFYDSDNTAYYVNPATSSNLIGVTIRGSNFSMYTGTYGMQMYSTADGAGNPGGWARSTNFANSTASVNLASFGALGGGDSITYAYLSLGTDLTNYSSGLYLRLYSGNYTEASGSIRAPIFYDSNDTGYYTDQNGTSNYNALTLAGTLRLPNNALINVNNEPDTWGARFRTTTSTTYLGASLQNIIWCGGGASEGFTVQGVGTGGAAFSVRNDGIAWARGSYRSPIFYDQDDTGYYLNPNGTSNLYTGIFNSGATFYSDGSSRAMYIRGSGNIIQFCDADGTFRWENVGRNGTYYIYKGYGSGAGYKFQINDDGSINVNNGSNTTIVGNLYAPIMYDSNDSGYYVDPNGTSRLNSINANSMTGSINGMPYDGNGISGMGPISNWDSRPTVGSSGYGINWHTGVTLSGYPGYGGVRLYSSGYPTHAGSVLRLEASYGVYTYGNFTNDSRVDAPIFYDRDNTGYYVNPNSTSNVSGMFQVNHSGSSGIQLLSTTGTQSLWIRTGWDSAPTPSVSFANVQFQSSGSAGGSFTFWSGNTLALSIYGDYAQGAGSLRAPVFYDSDNTGYYVNPNGVTYLGGVNDLPLRVLKTSGVNSACTTFENQNGDNSWGIVSEFRVGNNGSGTDRPSILFSNGYDSNTWTVGFGYADSSYFRINRDHGFRNGNWGTTLMQMDRSGNVTFSGNVTAYSDERIKTNIKKIDNALGIVRQLNGVTFDYIEDGRHGLGVIAQNVEKVLPMLVSEMPSSNGQIYKNVAYGNMVGVLIEAAKEQDQEIVDLRNRVAQLESLIHKLIGEQP
jgi:hypothetical protein